ncbi:MAG: hypothetical protein MJH09_01500 [Cetobacterium sp.]|nr:hypothetical protein [Cetobacterium sp.]
MKYFMHREFQVSPKLESQVNKYFNKVNTINTEVHIYDKIYKAVVDIKSFLLLSNFDCFNCLTNCCVQFPYEFNKKSRDLIKNNLKEYNNLTKAVSILKEEGMTEKEIIQSIENDPMLIPNKFIDTVFNRCTCSCVHIDRHLCAIHKICIDQGFSIEEVIDTKPLWCSIYPLEILINENEELYIFVPNSQNDYLSMNDSKFPCMDIKMSKSPYFRRENPIGFKEEDYKPFIDSYYPILKYIFGETFVKDIKSSLNLLKEERINIQYNKKI